MKRLMVLIAGTFALAVVVLLGSALVVVLVPMEADLSPYKAFVAREVRSRTGLELQVDGALFLQTGPVLGLRAKDVRIRSRGETQTTDVLKAGHIALELETLSLLYGVLEPRLLELEAARIQLERDASGRGNWEPDGAEAAISGAEQTNGLRFVAGRLRLRVHDSSMDYSDTTMADPLRVRVRSADVEPTDAGLHIVVDASVNDYPLQVKGTTATLSQLMERADPLPIDVEGELLGLSLRAEGKLVDPRAGGEVAADLRIRGESLRGLAPWLGAAASKLGPVEAMVRVSGKQNLVRIEPFGVTLGKGRFDGAAVLDLKDKRPRVQLTLSIDAIDLGPLLRRSEGTRPRTQKKSGAPLFGGERLPLDWMDAANGTAKVKVRTLDTGYATLTEMDADIELQGRRLGVVARGQAPGGRAFSADLVFDGATKVPIVKLRLKGDKLLIEPLIATTEAEGLIRGDVDVSAELQAEGESPDRMADALRGKIALLIEHAEADVKGLDQLVGGVNALVGQLVTPGQKLAKVNCGLVAFDFAGGRSQVQGLLDTPYSTVVAQGELDLGAETISLRVSPSAKGATLSVASPVSVRGSLSDPVVEVEKGGLLLTLTDLGSKVALPQLLLVDAFGNAVSANPCVKIAAGQIDQDSYGPAGTVVQGAGEVLNGVGDAVKGLFGGETKPKQ
jgi:AsmA protein